MTTPKTVTHKNNALFLSKKISSIGSMLQTHSDMKMKGSIVSVADID